MDSILTKKVAYVLKALYFLGIVRDNEMTSVVDIAAEIDAPKRFLEQLFLKLRKGGLLESIRGASGGYRLTRALSEITYFDLLEILETDAEAKRAEEQHGVFGEERFLTKLRDAVQQANQEIVLGELIDDTMLRQARMKKAGGYVYHI